MAGPSPLPLPKGEGERRAGAARRILRHVVGYSLSSFVYQAVSLTRSIVVARLLGPSLTGLWDALSLIPAYNISHLGVLQGIHREIPIARGRGDLQRVARLRDQGLCATVIPSLLLSGLTLLFAGAVWQRASPELRWGLLAVSGLLLLQQMQALAQVVLSADSRFGRLGVVQLVTSLVNLATIALVAHYGFPGQLWSALLAPLAFSLCGLWLAGYALHPLPNWALYRSLIAIGLPIALLVLADALLVGVDRLLIIARLGPTELGYYRVAVLATAFVAFVPTVVNQVIYPEISERFGAARSREALHRLFTEPVLALAHVLPLGIGAAWLLLPHLTALLLPAFTTGVPPARTVLVGLFFSSLLGTAWSVLIVDDRQLELLGWVSLAVALKAGLVWLFLSLGLGLLGAAVAASAAYIPYGLGLLVRAARLLGLGTREIAWFLARVLAPYLLALALTLALALARLERLAPPGLWTLDFELWTFVPALAFAALYVPAAYWLWRRR